MIFNWSQEHASVSAAGMPRYNILVTRGCSLGIPKSTLTLIRSVLTVFSTIQMESMLSTRPVRPINAIISPLDSVGGASYGGLTSLHP